MKDTSYRYLLDNLVVAAALAAVIANASGCENISGKTETRIGMLEFKGGYPTEETIQKAFEQLDVQRASQAYLEFMPMASMNSLFESHIRDYGMTTTGDRKNQAGQYSPTGMPSWRSRRYW